MAKLLYIESSPRKERAASIAVARRFLDVYRTRNPQDTIESLDLWAMKLPHVNGTTLDAKYAILHGQPHTPQQANAWKAVVTVAEQFKSADKYLFSVPMWNFSIPYVLKHYIDVLVQPGLTFTYSASEGYKGLVTGKPAVAVYSRGGAYGPGTGAEAYDKQTDYLRHVLGFIGLTDLKQILVEPTLAGPEAKDQAVAAGGVQAEKLAQEI
jgi:FMN-dependent NADH-azoreductase